MNVIKTRDFSNGKEYAIELDDGMPIEVTDTFLPTYTKDCINGNSNKLISGAVGDRSSRWMVGVSTMSGCPVGCKFCATGKLKKWRSLSATEIYMQVEFIVSQNIMNFNPCDSSEFKVNYTRMGEPFLNIDAVKEAIGMITERWPSTHHYISTIGIKNMDTSWVSGNTTLQLSLHSMDESRRDELIPFSRKMSISELGEVRTRSALKTTLNMSLVDDEDFDIDRLKKDFHPDCFFIKLSPINKNEISDSNRLGGGVIVSTNII